MSESCGSFGCTLPAGHNRGQADVPENHQPSPEARPLAELIWTTSRADEGTISATGANIIAGAIIASDWLREREARVRAEGVAEGLDVAKFARARGREMRDVRMKAEGAAQVRARVEAALRLIDGDHLTPAGKRQIMAALEGEK